MSCTMIITDANELAAEVHDRMPVLLQPKDFDGWLTGTAGAEVTQASRLTTICRRGQYRDV